MITTMKKYQTYDCRVDPDQDDKASEIKLCSFKRPHMRAFHFAWWSYHVAFLMWYEVAYLNVTFLWTCENYDQSLTSKLSSFSIFRFSISPLLTEVQDSLGLSKEQIWTSSISAVSGTIVMRFLLGPYCDKFGPRIPMGIILACSAIPTGMTGLVNSSIGLSILRFFIGIGGSSFVMCQYW